MMCRLKKSGLRCGKRILSCILIMTMLTGGMSGYSVIYAAERVEMNQSIEEQKPEAAEEEFGETDSTEQSVTEQQETEQLGTEQPETEQPETEQSTIEQPETEQQETEQQETEQPETEQQETKQPEPETETVEPAPAETENLAAEDEKDKTEDASGENDKKKDKKNSGDEKKSKSKKKKKKKAKVVEVTDLDSFIKAVEEASREDDLSPAYEFTKDSATAVVSGEEQRISAPVQKSGDTYVVPEDVFAADDAVSNEQISDGDGVVALNTVEEISDYEVMEQEETVELVNPFQNRRLVVKSPQGFDPYGAVHIIQGYEQIFVLTYETEEETKAAYEYLKSIPYLMVEQDTVVSSSTIAEIAESGDADAPESTETTEASDLTESSRMQEMEECHPVTVAVLDTGYDYNHGHPDRVKDGIDVSGANTVQDANGHGTAMTDIIMDATKDSISFLPVRITDDNGRSSSLKLYLGMEAALANGADILNVSMSAYKPADGSMIADEIAKLKERGVFVVTAAGNYSGDTADYVPANIEAAITVAAINTNDEADGYSNHGSTVDYSAYGSVTATVLGGKEETVSGTSVSAAIVSAIIADKLSKDSDAGYDTVMEYLDKEAKDLGEPGKDAVFGTGALYLDSITGNEEEEWEGLDAPILTCDWKNMSDESFDEILSDTDYGLIRFFLDGLTEEERAALLLRNTLLTHKSTVLEYNSEANDGQGELVRKETSTLYEYLYGENFSEYYVQKEIKDHVLSGTYYMYIRDNNYYKVKIDTSEAGTDAEIQVKFHGGTGGNPFTDPKVSVIATNAGAIDFSDMTIKGVTTFSDGTNANAIGQLDLNGIKISKPAHSKATSYSKSKDTAEELGGGVAGTWSGGITSYGNNTCSAESTKIHLAIGYGDLEINKKGKGTQVYTVNITTYGKTDWGDWSDWTTTKNATCTEKGSKYRTRTKKCENCKSVTDTDTKTEEIKELGHEWGNVYTSKYATCTEAGETRHSCQRCGTDEHVADLPALGHLEPEEWTYDKNQHWKKCERCDLVYVKDPEKHDFTSKEEKAATCTEIGTTRYTCTVCGYSYTADDIPALGHNWGENYTKIEPTCTKHGEKWHKCQRCEEEEYVETMFSLGHLKSGEYTYEDAHGIKDAIRYENCARCDTVLKKCNKYTLNVRYENADGTFTEYEPELSAYYLAYDDNKPFTFTPIHVPKHNYEADEIYQAASSTQPDYIGIDEYKCTYCNGTGTICTRDNHGWFQYTTCYACHGVCYIKPDYMTEEDCDYCHGLGTHVNNSNGTIYNCYRCDGTGRIITDSRRMDRSWEDFVTVYRQKYTITFDSTEPGTKNLPESKTVRAEEEVSLLDVSQPTAPKKRLYAWNTEADGSGTSYALYHTVTTTKDITLYAVWKPALFKITLDNQGADEGIDDTSLVYEMYEEGYYQDEDISIKFPDDRIDIPKKNIPAEGLPDGKRRQTFLGYYTQKEGAGYQVIKRDGSLIANINNAGNYKYFKTDTTIYAAWEDMYAIQFEDNLTTEDMEILSRDAEGNEVTNPVVNPDAQWKEKGEDITINYETVEICNDDFKDIYRLKGFSLTPEISNEDEIILSDEKTSYTFTADEDVVLYAQWDTSFMVTYVGNEQTEGTDYLDEVEDVTDSYTFSPNDAEQVAMLSNETADYFVKTIEKPTVDIKTGEETDEDGNPCMETVPCSFQGWSMFHEKENQDINTKYAVEDGEKENSELIFEAERAAQFEPGKGLTFGNPVEDYGTFNAPHMSTSELIAGGKGAEFSEQLTMTDIVKGYLAEVTGKPFVNMYAIWDEYPQIAASDLYFPLTYAQEGRITEDYLLSYAVAADEELKSSTNPDGKLKHGEDTVNKTKFTVLDYQTSDFLGAEADMAMTITYRAEDKVGNVTTKMVTVYLVDTTAQEYDSGNVRFISAEYADTLSEKSIWRTGEYAATLAEVLGNSKTGEEYTTVTALQQAFGAEPVKKPGSGTWNHVEQVWKFTHEEVLEVHDYVDANGLFGSQESFLSSFGHCRIQ